MRRLRAVPGGKSTREAHASLDDLYADLSTSSTQDTFVAPYLELQSRLVPGLRYAVLVLGAPGKGPFEVAGVWPEGQSPPRALLEGAQQAITRRVGLVAREATEEEPAPGTPAESPDPEAEAESPAPDPPQGSLIAQPLDIGGKLHGAVVLEVEPKPEPELRELLEQVRFGTGWLAGHLRRSGGRAGLSRKGRIELVPNLLAATLDHDRFAGASRAFVTELATELGCDRVGVGFLHRGRVRLEAISHASQGGRKTNLVRSIEEAMAEAIDQQATVVHPARDQTSVGTHAHADLARQHGAAALCTVPLVHAGKICGALTLERPEARPFDADTVQLCEAAGSLAGPVLEVMRLENRWVGLKLFESGRTWLQHLLGPHHVALKLGTALAVGLLLFLALAKGDYRVTADAVLEPVVLRAAVAPFEGYIASAPARAGDLVREADLLGALDARDLQLEQVKWTSQREQLLKQYRQALADRDASKVEIFAASLDEANAELARIGDRLARTELRAPFDGVVIRGDLTQQLGAPVEKGAVLFEVAPLDAYRVILQVEESDIAAVETGQTGGIVFSSLPEETYDFSIEKITPVALAEEGRNSFLVEAKLADAHPRLRPAIEGVAKIDAGRRRLIWIWTHDAVDWLRLTLWRWLP